jgi:selenocysteine lyase/cysteine desulfurase
MASAGVHVSVRGDAVRVSPHVYNDEADIDRLVEVLRATL